jgi:kinetochore protein NDC80
MIPRCAGPPSSSLPPSSGSTSADANRENNGRAVGGGGGGSGIAAPSPSSRHHNNRPPSAMRKSLGGAILQYGHGHHGASSAPAASYTPAKNRRVSLAPPVASSSSSSYPTTSTASSVPGSSSNVDPRDVRDRSYLQSAIRKMVSYLSSRGYGDASSLNVKQLVNSGPSGRDFQNIMTFLFRRVDPTFHSPSTAGNGNQRSDEVVLKFEDEVSMAFRCLGYPFPISKTGLVAVGSPHTWPALIAAIDWLVDLLAIRDEEEALDWGPDEGGGAADATASQTLDGSAERVRAQFHKFLRKSMVAFLNDDNDECEELEGALLDTFQKDSERVEMYLTGLDYECGKMREDIAALNEEVDG